MPEYKYRSSNLSGRVVRGQIFAENEEDLRGKLRENQLFLISFEEVSEVSPGQRIKPRQLADFCRELGTLIQAGVPLIRAFVIMSERDIPERQKKVYAELYKSLQKGYSLSEAMERQGRAFPALLTNMFRAGEAGGNLDTTALKMADHYDKSYKIARKVRSAMTYPIILLVVTVAVLLIIFLAVLPRFFAIFETMNATLPGITRFMLSLSEGLRTHWQAVLIFLLGFLLLIKLLVSMKPVRIFMNKMKLRMPVAGKFVKIICTARFARTLASLYTSGLSIMNALRNARGTIGNAYIESQFDTLMTNIRSGESLSEAVSKIDGFDKKLASCIVIGEETGKLDSMLSSMAESYDYELSMATEKLTSLIEPVMIVVLALVIGSIMISVMMPLTTLYSTIGSGL